MLNFKIVFFYYSMLNQSSDNPMSVHFYLFPELKKLLKTYQNMDFIRVKDLSLFLIENV